MARARRNRYIPPPARARPSDALRDETSMRVRLAVIARAVPVDHDDRVVADDPGVVTARKRGDVAGAGEDLGAVVHQDRKPATHVVLEVGCLATRGPGDRLDVVRPAPAGLEHEAADLAAADSEDLRVPVREIARLVGRLEALVLGFVGSDHGLPLLVEAD